MLEIIDRSGARGAAGDVDRDPTRKRSALGVVGEVVAQRLIASHGVRSPSGGRPRARHGALDGPGAGASDRADRDVDDGCGVLVRVAHPPTQYEDLREVGRQTHEQVRISWVLSGHEGTSRDSAATGASLRWAMRSTQQRRQIVRIHPSSTRRPGTRRGSARPGERSPAPRPRPGDGHDRSRWRRRTPPAVGSHEPVEIVVPNHHRRRPTEDGASGLTRSRQLRNWGRHRASAHHRAVVRAAGLVPGQSSTQTAGWRSIALVTPSR